MIPMTAAGMAALLAVGLIIFGPGYLLWTRAAPHKRSPKPQPSPWPQVDIVVAVHDEARQIAAKIENLRQLDYQAERLRFWIVDGASDDFTCSAARAAFGDDSRFRLLEAGVANKTAQLNLVLPRCAAAWILVTDADARMAPGSLKVLVREGESDSRIGAVGTTVFPVGAHPLERLHWRIADWLRLRESDRGSASIVTAPCYLMRRGLVVAMPEDVVADDVHIAFSSAAAGCRTAFTAAEVTELRSPVSLSEMLRHKHRKAHAYLREIFRFLPRARRMPVPARTTFLWRSAQMLLIPPAGVILLAALVRIAARQNSLSAPAILAGAAVAILGSLVLGRRTAIGSLVGLFTVLSVVLFGAFLSLPFFRQHACFRKVDAARNPATS